MNLLKIGIITIAAAGFVFIMLFSYTPSIKGSRESIASLEKIELGNTKQWILLRGKRIDNPIILFLHGGPGTAEMGLSSKYLKALERNFLMVNWDQRAAGKSFSFFDKSPELTIDTFVDDTIELTEYLCRRFNKNKIYLIGHSWGSLLGMKTIQLRPDLYFGFIGTGQLSNGPLQEQVGYERTLELSRAENNEKAINDLLEIGPPDENGRYKDGMEGTAIERKWMTAQGGFLYGKSNYNSLLRDVLLSREYSGLDIIRYFMGMNLKAKNRMVETEVLQADLMEEIPSVEIPVCFMLGRHDLNCPSEVSADYWKQLRAPVKKLLWFEESSHSPCFEEPELFIRETEIFFKS